MNKDKLKLNLFVLAFLSIANTYTFGQCSESNNAYKNLNTAENISDEINCPNGNVVINEAGGTGSITFDQNATYNNFTVNFQNGNKPIKFIIPSGVTINITGSLTFFGTNPDKDKFLDVFGTLIVGGNIDFGGIEFEIDGTGSISAGSISGAGNTSCGSTNTCPTFNVSGSCGPAGSGLCAESALPIELLSFGVYESNGMMRVNWATASEINNDYFTLERSSDGLSYQSIATVAGAGNSSEELEYSYVDRNPLFGRSYYRLKQTDFDGASETFAPVAVDFTSLSNGDITFTNPVRSGEEVTVYANTDETENLKLIVFNMVGEKIIDQNFSGVSYSFQLDADVRPGIYFVKISSVSTEKTGRLVVR